VTHIASPHSPDRNFPRSIRFTDSEIGLVLLLYLQITFDPSSIKTAHATPTEKSTPSLVPRHSPIQDPHDHGRRSSRFISFRSSLAHHALMACRVEAYLLTHRV